MSIAIVIGATGLVGKCLVRQLLDDPLYPRVVALVRRATPVQHEKYQEHVVNFAEPASFAELVRGDVLFSSMGTTRSQAGSLEAQRMVDYTFQFQVAKLAAQNGVRNYVLVSAGGAKVNSWSAYLKMKGELERDVQTLGFSSVHILRPGLLKGEREQARSGERFAEGALGALNAVGVLPSLRPITGEQVATFMRHAATLRGSRVHEPGELFTPT